MYSISTYVRYWYLCTNNVYYSIANIPAKVGKGSLLRYYFIIFIPVEKNEVWILQNWGAQHQELRQVAHTVF